MPLGVLLEKDERAFRENAGNHPFVPAILQMVIITISRDKKNSKVYFFTVDLSSRKESFT